MATMTTNERRAYAALKATIARLRGPQAPAIASPLDRVQFIRQHMNAIGNDARVGSLPSSMHLVAIAAHAMILYGELDDGD
jgi:hypothetical protein